MLFLRYRFSESVRYIHVSTLLSHSRTLARNINNALALHFPDLSVAPRLANLATIQVGRCVYAARSRSLYFFRTSPSHAYIVCVRGVYSPRGILYRDVCYHRDRMLSCHFLSLSPSRVDRKFRFVDGDCPCALRSCLTRSHTLVGSRRAISVVRSDLLRASGTLRRSKHSPCVRPLRHPPSCHSRIPNLAWIPAFAYRLDFLPSSGHHAIVRGSHRCPIE